MPEKNAAVPHYVWKATAANGRPVAAARLAPLYSQQPTLKQPLLEQHAHSDEDASVGRSQARPHIGAQDDFNAIQKERAKAMAEAALVAGDEPSERGMDETQAGAQQGADAPLADQRRPASHATRLHGSLLRSGGGGGGHGRWRVPGAPPVLGKRGPECMRECIQQGILHPVQCHSLC